MNTLTFIQSQIGEAIDLLHLDVVIFRLGLVNLPGAVLERLPREERSHNGKHEWHPHEFEHRALARVFTETGQRYEQ